MLTTIAKRIQSRLSRQGVKVSLGEVKSQCELTINDIDNPSEIELLAVQEYFMSAATSLTVINDISDVRTQSIQDTDDISDDDDSAIALNENTTPNTSAPLATTTKNELIASTANSLGIELSTADIENIADNFDAGSDDFTQTLEQVKGAIIAYVQHKIASNNQKIVNTINEICQVASDGFEENSQTLTNGLKQLNQQLVQQSADFKSKLAGTLSRFKLPEAS
ncbi:MAG: hypothetical protein ACKPGQ_11575 [Dolichospermum sp.]